ncbi:nucleotidyltransferase family protein [Novosphingobium album (ex Liu et al. 2023)]|uniref:Nucleotidyltransferase family protein n=1 Tax=Novosphingobium album (ex Liu et al. 2023) TaxID=3031130 RepID=A0ABT5WV55_9SPHN|nr:nucleotidyltransferase family protein [Novosphingobium album (ex Liu et al. 2023)]MDE8653758.1 nucleotidyltransferase family protein [Novosphingobium album (ex Liu et al. 2023)]
MTPTALVLAGSRPGVPDPVARAEGLSHKSLVEVDGQAMLARVVAAVREAGIIACVVATGDAQVAALAADLGCEVLPSAEGPSASVAAAFTRYGAPMLVTTADHALLEGRWIAGFLDDTPPGADVAVLMARREAIERAMPGSRRTYMRFADGEWSGCNLFLLATPRAWPAIETWSAVEADRKRPWRIAMRLGLRTLFDYARGRLTLNDALARLGRRVGLTACAVPARDGLAAVDVDKVEDLADVRRLVAARPAITCISSGCGST